MLQKFFVCVYIFLFSLKAKLQILKSSLEFCQKKQRINVQFIQVQVGLNSSLLLEYGSLLKLRSHLG